MKITPLEIRQKSFEKEFRGYHKDEVNAFLHTLSLEWEKLMNENKESQKRIDQLEKEVNKLKEVESSLYKTLKTAEDTGANMIDQANRMAEIHMKETEVRAEAILNDAKNKAHDTIEEAEMIARQTIDEMEDQLKDLMHAYKTLENFREDLISDIRSISTDALDRIERQRKQLRKIDLDEFMVRARREGKKAIEDRMGPAAKSAFRESAGIERNKKEKKEEIVQEVPKTVEAPQITTEEQQAPPPAPKAENTKRIEHKDDPEISFFDEID